MTSVRGHLLSQDFSQRWRKWHSCSPIELLGEGVIESFCADDMKGVYDNLQSIAKKSNVLVLWTDCDREGEHIGYEIKITCDKVKANLSCFRAQFSCCIKTEVTKAVQTLRRLNMGMVNAVIARQELDLRIGAAFTRFQTLLLQQKYSEIEGVVSFGTCQVPTLGFIVEQQKKVESFVAEDFWSLKMKYTERKDSSSTSTSTSTSESSTSTSTSTSSSTSNRSKKSSTSNRGKKSCTSDPSADFTWKRGRLFHRASCLALFESCVAAGRAVVTKDARNPKTKWKPVPLSTIEMTKRLSRSRHMSAKKIQDTAEKLYNNGILSYPRTETEIFRDDFDLRGLIAPHVDSPQWGSFAQNLLGGNGFGQPRKGPNDDHAHPPIHPLKFVPLSSLNDDERKVYEFVVRHFLACCSKDARGSGVNVEVTMGTEVFCASGLAIEERNYLEVYIYDRWQSNTIPDLRLGDVFTPTSLTMQDSRTRSPQYMSEADLIAIMEKNGIGTDATMGSHIEKIKERKYVSEWTEQGGQPRMKAEKLGVALVDGYTALNIAFSKPQIRQQMEKDSIEIEKGRKTKDAVVRQCLEAHIAHYRTMEIQKSRFADALDDVLGEHFSVLGQNEEVVNESIGWCGDCNVTMCLKKQKKGQNSYDKYLLWCDDCSTCFSNLPSGTVTDANIKCACGYGKVTITTRNSDYKTCPKCRAEATPAVEVTVGTCVSSNCNSKRLLLQQRNGKWQLSCASSNCGYLLRMPRQTKLVKPRVDGGQHRLCGDCKRLPKFQVTLEGRLEPGEENEYTRCLRCDEYLRQGLSGHYETFGDSGGGGGGGGRGGGNGRGAGGGGGGRGGRSGGGGRSGSGGQGDGARNTSTRSKSSSGGKGARSRGTKARGPSARGCSNTSGTITCNQCQNPAEKLTAKTGKNQGRQFWKCRECDNWLGWCDEVGKEDGKRGRSGQKGGTKRRRTGSR